jgi:hypothetical protein
LYLSSLGIPVYLLIRLTSGGLPSDSPAQFWGIFTTGMVLSAALAMLAELLLLALLVAMAVVYLVVHPDQWTSLRHLGTSLAGVSGMEQLLETISPWLTQPWVFVVALVIFSGFTPLIEETAKSAAVWLVFDRIISPARGFLAGAISGAGFGLLESLLAAATPDPNWTITLIVRGGSTMMHVMSGGLAGWGIASYRSTKRPRRLFLGFAAAFLLHGIWNASVLAVGFGAARMTLAASSPGLMDLCFVIGGGTALGAMCIAIPAALLTTNRRLRLGASGPLPAHAISAIDHDRGRGIPGPSPKGNAQ